MGAPTGCYGFRLDGVDGARDLLVDVPASWPGLELRVRPAAGPVPEMDVVGPRAATLPLHASGWMEIEHDGPRITFHLPEPPPDHGELVHPYLAPGAAVLARWTSREAFHAGVIAAGDGAWAVLGDRESGKSSTLGWLAAQGRPVLADDLLVLDGGDALAGPRCIDLREDAARRLDAGEPLGVVGTRERWRLRLGPVEARMPLRGWIVPQWGDDVAVEPVRGAERLSALIPYRSVRLEPPDPGALVALASLPMLRWRRPRRWDVLAHALDRLLAAVEP